MSEVSFLLTEEFVEDFHLPRSPKIAACYGYSASQKCTGDSPSTLAALRANAPVHARDVVLIALEGELARHEWHERLAQRPMTALGVSAASLLEQDRQQREQHLP